MKVKVITAFNDMLDEDPDTRRREIGTEIDVDDARGMQLIALKLVEPVEGVVVEGVPFGVPPLDLVAHEQTPIAQASHAAVSDALHLTADMATTAGPVDPAS